MCPSVTAAHPLRLKHRTFKKCSLKNWFFICKQLTKSAIVCAYRQTQLGSSLLESGCFTWSRSKGDVLSVTGPTL
jgi:hypothetical protein